MPSGWGKRYLQAFYALLLESLFWELGVVHNHRVLVGPLLENIISTLGRPWAEKVKLRAALQGALLTTRQIG